MRFQINQNSLSGKRKIFLLVGAVTLVLLIIVIAIHPKSKPKSDGTLIPNEYFDKASGETVSNPEDKAPDTYGAAADEPVYLGISKLLDYGLTLQQLNATKKAFLSYSNSLSPHISEVSVDVSSISALPPDETKDNQTLNFKVQLDRNSTYDAQIDYSGLHTMRLYLRSGGKIIFDSGEIN